MKNLDFSEVLSHTFCSILMLWFVKKTARGALRFLFLETLNRKILNIKRNTFLLIQGVFLAVIPNY